MAHPCLPLQPHRSQPVSLCPPCPEAFANPSETSCTLGPGQVTDLVSFYTLPSTILGHPDHNELRAAYMYYTGGCRDAVCGCVWLRPASQCGARRRSVCVCAQLAVGQ